MDFFIRDKNSLIPVEVKANDNSTVSLNNLSDSDSYKDIKYGIKLCNKNIGFNGKYLLANYTSLKEMNLTYLNTNKITDMSWMFSSNVATNIMGLNSFDTSKVTNMDGMFASSSSTTGYARNQDEVDKFNASIINHRV